MATYNLRRFAHADGFKFIFIAREHLLALLMPHQPYFDGRGLTLPPPSPLSPYRCAGSTPSHHHPRN
jgi:hypothetical protein